MGRIVFVLLSALVFTIPWENMVAFEGFGTLSRAIGLGAAGCGIAAVIGRGQFRRLKLMHYLMGLFALFVLLSLTWSPDPQSSAERVMTFAQLVGMAWLIWEFAATPLRQRLLMHAYVLGACVALLTQWLPSAQVRALSRMEGARFGGGGLNINDFALIVLISMAFAVFYATDKQSKSKLLRVAYGVYCPLAAFGILMTGSRMGFVILLFGTLLIVLLHLRRRAVYALVLVAVAAVFVLNVGDWVPRSTLKRLTSSSEVLRTGKDSGSWGVRLNIWNAALKMYPRHPLIGTGSGSFRFVIGEELERGPYPRQVDAHNVYVRVLVELGVVGAFLFGMVLLTAATCALRMPNRERLLWIAIAAMWGLGACALSIEDRKLLWFLLGLLTSQYATLRQQEAFARARNMMALLRPRRRLATVPG